MVAEELLNNLPGELGMRTSLSRGYYGLFHSAQAALLAHGDKKVGLGLRHGTVSTLFRKTYGEDKGKIYEDAYLARKAADYESAVTFDPVSVVRQLKTIRAEVDSLCLEAEQFLR